MKAIPDILLVALAVLVALDDFRTRLVHATWLAGMTVILLAGTLSIGIEALLGRILLNACCCLILIFVGILAASRGKGLVIGVADIWMLLNLGIALSLREYLQVMVLLCLAGLLYALASKILRRGGGLVPLAGIAALFIIAFVLGGRQAILELIDIIIPFT